MAQWGAISWAADARGCRVTAAVMSNQYHLRSHTDSHCSYRYHLSPVVDAMDERISLTRHVAASMLSSKPWRSLLHSTMSRAVAVQRLHNILTLFPELLRDRKRRDQLYSLVDVITPLLVPLPTTVVAEVTATVPSSISPLLFQLYVSALADRIVQLLPYFTASQQLHVAKCLHPHVDRFPALLSSALATLHRAFLSQQPFAELHLAPHHLTFASSQQLSTALHSSSSNPPTLSTASPVSSPSAPIHLPLPHLPRLPCPSCSTAQRFYCGRCYRVVHPLAAAVVPRVSLPFQLHIVLHPRFDRSKSTALHCRLLCPTDDVTVHDWPRLPRWNEAATFVMWPDEQATDVSQLVIDVQSSSRSTTRDLTCRTERPAVVLLEGTWEQATEMRRAARLACLPSIRPSQTHTSFWRWQDRGAAHLSSIEAVYQVAVQWSRAQQVPLDNDLDNLLWLFALGWTRVRDYYAQHPQLLPPVSHSGYQSAEAAAVT